MEYEFKASQGITSDELVIHATTELNGRTVSFALPIERTVWEDLFEESDEVNSEYLEVYQRAPVFWNLLVQEAAEDSLDYAIKSGERRIRLNPPSLEQVALRYKKFKADGSH